MLLQNFCYVFWEVKEKWTVSLSVRSCLIFQMLMKTFRECHNMWWIMGVQVRYQNKRSVVALCVKIVATAVESMSESIRCEGVDPNLMGRALLIMSLFHMIRWSLTVLLWGYEVLEGGRAKEDARGAEKQGLDAAPWHCTCSRVSPCQWIFWWSTRWLSSPNLPTHQIWSMQTSFLFPRLNYTLKGHWFQAMEEVEKNLLQNLCTTPHNAFQNWRKCW